MFRADSPKAVDPWPNFASDGSMFRYSPRPCTLLLWFWLMRDAPRLSRGKKIGIDAGCGKMQNRPWFQTDEYIGVDWEQERMDKGMARWPGAKSVQSRLEDVSGIAGDFVMCVLVFHNKFFDPELTLPVVRNLISMVRPGGR